MWWFYTAIVSRSKLSSQLKAKHNQTMILSKSLLCILSSPKLVCIMKYMYGFIFSLAYFRPWPQDRITQVVLSVFLEESRLSKIASEIFWPLQTIYDLQLVMNQWICFRSRHQFAIPWLIFKAVLRHWSPPDCWLDAQKLSRKTRVSMSPPLLLRSSGFCHIFNAWKRVVIRNLLSKNQFQIFTFTSLLFIL